MVQARGFFAKATTAVVALSLNACAGDAEGPADDDDAFRPLDIARVDRGPTRIEAATAPDEYTIEVRLTVDPDDERLSLPETFVLDSSRGHRLQVLAASYEPARRLVRLQTERQKLGVTYGLSFATWTGTAGSAEPDAEVAELHASIPSADTARLWANNFGADDFPSYEVVAERVAVGEHCVVYLEQGLNASGIDAAVATFDERIFPIESALFGDVPDQDDNGKVLLFGLNGGAYYGGYFFTGNTLTEEEAMAEWGYHSNEMDMLYVNIATGDFDADVIVAHEFAHLLYAERHGALSPSFAYHNEGLAECAVHAVHGAHPWALPHFMNDPLGQIGQGISLLDWSWGDYDYYAKAYVFWSYLAAQLGGVEVYGTLFDLNGDPDVIAAFAEAELGVDFATLQLDVLVATWLRAPSGPYGFGDMLSFPAGAPPSAPEGTKSLELGPTAGTYLLFPGETSVDYPGSQGESIRYAGIDWTGKVDLEAPFDIDGGALVVLNAGTHTDAPSGSEPSGPVMPPEGSAADGSGDDGSGPSAPTAMPLGDALALDRSWLHPPPLVPGRLDSIKQWRKRTLRGGGAPAVLAR